MNKQPYSVAKLTPVQKEMLHQSTRTSVFFPLTPCDSVGTPLGLSASTTAITAFGGHNIPHYGTCMLNLTYNGHSNSYPFHVVNTGGPTFLGLPTCTDMNLITLNYNITQTESTPATSTTSTSAPATGTNLDINSRDRHDLNICWKSRA